MGRYADPGIADHELGGLAVARGQVQQKKESGELPAGEPPAAEAPVVEETPEDKVEPDQPAQDDNQADASADEA